jgi:hypothetical protein
MKKVITSIIQQILCAAVVTFCLPSLVLAQQQDRVVDWQPVVIKSETNVLEIVDIKIAGKSITIGRSFTADDNWLNALTFRVRMSRARQLNISDLALLFLNFELMPIQVLSAFLLHTLPMNPFMPLLLTHKSARLWLMRKQT